MNATVIECGTVLDWLWAAGSKGGKESQANRGFPVPNRKLRDLERVNKEQIPRRSASRNDNRVGSFSHPNFTKRRGEYGEAAFLTKAASMGIGVAKPWGDSDRYDFIIDAGGRLLRVQVKSAHCECAQPGGGYHIRAHPHQRVPYTTREIDLLVAYIVPEDIWYVFPPSAFQHIKGMRLFPHHKQKLSKFEQYREAWEWVWK